MYNNIHHQLFILFITWRMFFKQKKSGIILQYTIIPNVIIYNNSKNQLTSTLHIGNVVHSCAEYML